jgi:aspartate/methionine/tyrosine aminotransferase
MPMPLLKKSEGNNAIASIMSARPEINFGGGWGNHAAPEKLRLCFEDVIRNNFHAASRYSKTRGNDRFLEVLTEKLEAGVYERKNIQLKNVISGNGSTELTACLFKSLLQEGDRVLLSDPCYANYLTQAATEGRHVEVKRIAVLDKKLNFLPATSEGKFLQDFEQKIDIVKPRLMIITTPDNPLSQVWPSEVVEKMCEIALRHQVWLALDVSYRSIHFGERPSYYKLSFNDYENLITIHSFSKDFSLLGFRAAYIIAREDVILQLEHLEGARNLSPTTLVQMGLLKFFENSNPQELEAYFKENRLKYLRTSQIMVEALRKELGKPTLLTPNGGFYVILNIADYGFKNDAEFAARLSNEQKVAVVPGSAFGKRLKDSLRLSYAPHVEQQDLIEEGVWRLGKCLKRA